MKILIFGGSGQVGRELQRCLAPLGGLLVPGQGDLPRIDLADHSALERIVSATAPDIIFNAAAYTAVDKAETERDLAWKINAEAPGVIARAAQKIAAPIFHYSTDYVFSGTGSAPHEESDETRPLNHYGVTKLAGENEVAAAKGSHLILRTSWVYAPHGKNFLNTMLRLAAERDALQIVDDQHGTPTSAAFIGQNTLLAVRHLLREPGTSGLYHLVPRGETTWFGLAQYVLTKAHAKGLLPRLPELQPIPSARYPQAAQRPMNSRLSTQKFQRRFGVEFPDWREGLGDFLSALHMAGARGFTGPAA
jgi:dTDP-4-dehydrorhamnose reductase